jgi:hypothetical protein
MPDSTSTDLGFSYRKRKDGAVEIRRGASVAATLRGKATFDFLAEAKSCTSSELQQLMARLTGNYKRGNERFASEHPRNRR